MCNLNQIAGVCVCMCVYKYIFSLCLWRSWHAEWFICDLSPLFTKEVWEKRRRNMCWRSMWCGWRNKPLCKPDFNYIQRHRRLRMRWGNRGWKTYLDASVLKCFQTPEKSRPLLEKMQEAYTIVICVYSLIWVVLLDHTWHTCLLLFSI